MFTKTRAHCTDTRTRTHVSVNAALERYLKAISVLCDVLLIFLKHSASELITIEILYEHYQRVTWQDRYRLECCGHSENSSATFNPL